MSADEAVTAAAEALDIHYIRQHWDDYGCSCGVTGTEPEVRQHIAEVAVVAARPVIEREVRAKVAAEILAGCTAKYPPCTNCLRYANIVRKVIT